MARRTREDHLVEEERLEPDAAVAPGRPDDPELELSRGNTLDHRVGVRDGEEDANCGVLVLKFAEQDGDRDRGRPRRGAEDEITRELPFDRGRHGRYDLLLEREEPLRAT